jgi:hypothetical protein
MSQVEKTLLLLLDDVRGKTLQVLDGLDDAHARWAPPGLQNSCLWHGGHSYVVVEFLTMRALGREPKMPDGWVKMFSWESNPAHTAPESWPPLSAIVAALREQHARLREVIAGLTGEQLDAMELAGHERTVRFAIMHGLNDEARHSGEISLLRKLMTQTFVVHTPSRT